MDDTCYVTQGSTLRYTFTWTDTQGADLAVQSARVQFRSQPGGTLQVEVPQDAISITGNLVGFVIGPDLTRQITGEVVGCKVVTSDNETYEDHKRVLVVEGVVSDAE